MSHRGYAQRCRSPHWTGDHSNPDLIKGDKHSGFHISAKALDIIWGNDQRFWQWVDLDRNELSKVKFQQGAEMIQVNWVEVKGKLDAANLSPGRTYRVLFMIKFKPAAFGWRSSHITFEVTPPQGRKNRNTQILEQYRKQSNVWHEVHGGEFTLTSNNRATVEFGMSGDGSDWWKGGIILGGVVIKPI